ncbi:MAG: chaperonin GroEL [Chloroflexi bacterium]|nr:chaperonin GroEL [Chloroflexota bacterium]
MAKLLRFDDQARAALKRGVDIMADAVKTTLGPKGRNVAFNKKFGLPTVTHDGVTVAKEIELADPFENMGAQMLKEAATRTNDVAGDGTTTATLLAQVIVHEGLRAIAAGVNPARLKRGLEKSSVSLVGEIRKVARPVVGREDIGHIAAISSGDRMIGDLLADALDRVGRDGVITVEASQRTVTETEFVDGLSFDKGYVSPYFVTNSERMEAFVEDPWIVITDKKVSELSDVVPILERAMNRTKALCIIAEDMDGEALSTLLVNKMRGTLDVVAVKAPGWGDRRRMLLEDIAVMTGGRLMTEEAGRKLESIMIEDFGRARRVSATANETTIVGGLGTEASIRARVAQLRTMLAESAQQYEREQFQERLGKLSGGVGVIRVGAGSETETKEKKFRVEDALAATRAAIEEGVVPGGGIVLLTIQPAIDALELIGDEAVGGKIVQRALEEPLRQLAANAGADPSVIVDEVRRRQREAGSTHVGWNVVTGEFMDVVEAGIIDPAKVTRSVVENAISIAGIILTTDVLVNEKPEIKDTGVGPGVGMQRDGTGSFGY